MEQKNQDILQKQKCFFFKKKQNIKVTELTSLIKISTSQFPQFTETIIREILENKHGNYPGSWPSIWKVSFLPK
jgi:hypothetical protein